MREIKFRALVQRQMAEVHEISFGMKQDILLVTKEGEEFRDQGKNIDIMQYTGLKDKNGKEIYEGDILKNCACYTDINAFYEDKIKSPKDRLLVVEIPKIFYDFFEHDFDIENLDLAKHQVIGNIYENPELLEKVN